MSRRGAYYRKPNLVSCDPTISNDEKHRILTDPKFKGCDIKIPFPTMEQAQAVIDRAGKRPSGRARVKSYKCKYCPNYHLTSNTGR